tara:strand:+ start:21749 stop:22486 length:738 start_codon:yes stop_codon:yes gene_type:complete
MPISDEFELFKAKCLEAWDSTSATSPAMVTDIYRHVGPHAGPRMRMGFFDVRSDNWQQWRTHTIHEMDAVSAFNNSERIFADGPLLSHPNNQYLNDFMIPRIKSVISSQEYSITFIKYMIDHSIIGFESLYLPQKSSDRPEWVMFISNIRFVLKQIEITQLDKVDAAIIQLLIEGDTAKEMAIKLNTNFRTIEYRIARLKTMLNARNTIQLVALLVGNQLSDLILDHSFIPKMDPYYGGGPEQPA